MNTANLQETSQSQSEDPQNHSLFLPSHPFQSFYFNSTSQLNNYVSAENPTFSSSSSINSNDQQQSNTSPSSAIPESATNSISAEEKPIINGSAEEWENYRKQTHREIERRRRDVINEGINELAKLIPTPEKNKGRIIMRAVEYILDLQTEKAEHLEKCNFDKVMSNDTIAHLHSSAEYYKKQCQQMDTKYQALYVEYHKQKAKLEALTKLHTQSHPSTQSHLLSSASSAISLTSPTSPVANVTGSSVIPAPTFEKSGDAMFQHSNGLPFAELISDQTANSSSLQALLDQTSKHLPSTSTSDTVNKGFSADGGDVGDSSTGFAGFENFSSGSELQQPQQTSDVIDTDMSSTVDSGNEVAVAAEEESIVNVENEASVKPTKRGRKSQTRVANTKKSKV